MGLGGRVTVIAVITVIGACGAIGGAVATLAGCNQILGLEEPSGDDEGCCIVDPDCLTAPAAERCAALGCAWDTAPACAGIHDPCVAGENAAECTLHAGCSWDGAACSGTPEPCATHPLATCSQHASCGWSQTGSCVPPGDCDGVPRDRCRTGCAWTTTCEP